MTEADQYKEVVDNQHRLQAELADLIEKLDRHVKTYGGSRNLSIAKTNLETAALWMLAEDGDSVGTSILDGLRGI